MEVEGVAVVVGLEGAERQGVEVFFGDLLVDYIQHMYCIDWGWVDVVVRMNASSLNRVIGWDTYMIECLFLVREFSRVHAILNFILITLVFIDEFSIGIDVILCAKSNQCPTCNCY